MNKPWPWNQEKADEFIPEHMHDALRRWIEHGIEPGSFLTAVLTNDLKEAVACADHINMNALPRYILYLHNYAPRGCWGSKERVRAWEVWHHKKVDGEADHDDYA